MFEDLIIFPVVLVAGLIVSYFAYKKNKKIPMGLRILGVFGIFIHELSHFLMLLATGGTPSHLRVSYRHFHGTVGLKNFERMTFLQLFLTALAPLLVISYLVFYCWQIFITPAIDDLYRTIAIVVMVSLLIGSPPSRPDIRAMIHAFNTDPLYSLYQIALVLLSLFIMYLISFSVIFPYYLSFVYYILTGIVYYLLKYTFIGIRRGCSALYRKFSTRPTSISSSELYRTRHSPKKEKKQKIERGQW